LADGTSRAEDGELFHSAILADVRELLFIDGVLPDGRPARAAVTS
jgi:hypothetical protein